MDYFSLNAPAPTPGIHLNDQRLERTNPAFLRRQAAAGVRSVIKLCIEKNGAVFVVLGV